MVASSVAAKVEMMADRMAVLKVDTMAAVMVDMMAEKLVEMSVVLLGPMG